MYNRHNTMTEIQQLWNRISEIVQTEIPAYRFDVWIKTLDPLCIKDGRLVLLAPTATSKAVVVQNYIPMLKSAAAEAHPAVQEVDIVAPDELEAYMNAAAPAEQGKKQEKETEREKYNTPNMFDSRYTFDSFVVGKSNQFLYAAAKAVADDPGIKHNPLFIYCGTGLGKTHILHAIGNHIRVTRGDLKVLYVTSENFINELVASIAEKNTKEFRKRYRYLDVLMIDDIQFIANKTSLQEEIFHTFNDLYDGHKQIVISSDKPPKDISPLEERLRSRFEWGLLADVQPPDLITRMAILQKKAYYKKFNVRDEVLELIASKDESNIREMEGMLEKVVFYASLEQKPLTRELALEVLKDYIKDNTEAITADAIIDTICKYYPKATRADIIGKKKNREIVEPRMMCIYFICEILSMPLTAIGQIFGGRDHTTIMHSRDTISKQVKNSPEIKKMVADMRAMIYKK